MKKLVLIVSMFSIVAASTSALAAGCGNTSVDRNGGTGVVKTRTSTVSSVLSGGSV